MKSDTQSSFGRSAANWRFTRSGARGDDLSGRVVRMVRDLAAPRISSSDIKRVTRPRSTTTPCSRLRVALILRAP